MFRGGQHCICRSTGKNRKRAFPAVMCLPIPDGTGSISSFPMELPTGVCQIQGVCWFVLENREYLWKTILWEKSDANMRVEKP
jgi:hypothetical protein